VDRSGDGRAVGPVRRHDGADPVDGTSVLYGGYSLTGFYQGTTWTWNGQRWHLASTTGPSMRWEGQAAADPATGTILEFGGYSDTSGITGTTWQWTPVTTGYDLVVPTVASSSSTRRAQQAASSAHSRACT